MAEIEYRDIVSGTGFWDNVRKYESNINKLAKNVSAQYDISEPAINMGASKNKEVYLKTAIAIAGTLGIPLEYLTSLDNVVSADSIQGHEELLQALNVICRTFEKAYGVKLNFSILHNVNNAKPMLHKTQTHLSIARNCLPLHFTCIANPLLNSLYPPCNYDIRNGVEYQYNVINGNIYPSECEIISDEVVSIYDFINDFCVHGRSYGQYRLILSWLQSYRKRRYSLGSIGALSPDAYYWFQYMLGYFLKHQQN